MRLLPDRTSLNLFQITYRRLKKALFLLSSYSLFSGILHSMDELTKAEIRELLELTRENNELLRSANNRARWSVFFWVLRWAITLGLLVGAYYYIEPYVDIAKDTYQRASTVLNDVQSGSDAIKNSNAAKILNGENSEEQNKLIEKILKSLGL